MKLSPEVRGWYDALPEDRAARLLALHRRILKRHPRVAVSLDYRMPTFRNGEAWVSIGNQKRYISVYTCMRAHIEPYLKQHPKTKAGTGCLNFPDNTEIDLDALDRVIDHALDPANVPAHPKPKSRQARKRTA